MLIQASAFWMGSDAHEDNERPLHRVFGADLWMGRHKVTNRELARFLVARGLVGPQGNRYLELADHGTRMRRIGGRFVAEEGFEDHPAVDVTWFGARDYCEWVGKRL